MNRWIPVYVATALSFACVQGCSRREPDTTKTTTTATPENTPTAASPALEGQTTGGATAATAPMSLTSDDKDFVTKAAQGGMLEVALGEAAAKNAGSPDIKAFGQGASHVRDGLGRGTTPFLSARPPPQP